MSGSITVGGTTAYTKLMPVSPTELVIPSVAFDSPPVVTGLVETKRAETKQDPPVDHHRSVPALLRFLGSDTAYRLATNPISVLPQLVERGVISGIEKRAIEDYFRRQEEREEKAIMWADSISNSPVCLTLGFAGAGVGCLSGSPLTVGGMLLPFGTCLTTGLSSLIHVFSAALCPRRADDVREFPTELAANLAQFGLDLSY